MPGDAEIDSVAGAAPVLIRDRRRTRTPYRNRPVRHLSFWLRDFHLHRRLRGSEPSVGSIHAGLYRQRHLDGV
jgi:hypothetical protein